jgi:hypothetical protein
MEIRIEGPNAEKAERIVLSDLEALGILQQHEYWTVVVNGVVHVWHVDQQGQLTLLNDDATLVKLPYIAGIYDQLETVLARISDSLKGDGTPVYIEGAEIMMGYKGQVR